jgi:hypothetical protein
MTPAVSSAAPGRETDLNFHWPRIHDGWAAAGAVAGANAGAIVLQERWPFAMSPSVDCDQPHGAPCSVDRRHEL